MVAAALPPDQTGRVGYFHLAEFISQLRAMPLMGIDPPLLTETDPDAAGSAHANVTSLGA